MTIEGLSFVNSCIEKLNIPYQFMEWKSKIPDTYFVGEYTELETMDESGREESSFILTGTTNRNYMELESVRGKLKEYFTNEGLTAILDSGSGIAVFYDSSFPVPSIDEGVRRIQINLKVKEWRC
jgi:hypothetical protein